jgi:hypothetical protein
VLSRQYGAILLDTLPPARRIVGPWSELRPELERLFRA